MTLRYDILRHAIGVQPYTGPRGLRWSKPYRNYYVASEGLLGSRRCCLELVQHGLMREGSAAFHVTDAGQRAAMAGLVVKRRWAYGVPSNLGEDEADWLLTTIAEAP